MGSSNNFKLDISCVERDEDRADFLSACGQLDFRAIRNLVDVKGVDVKGAVDCIGQNCIHFVVCSSSSCGIVGEAAELQRRRQVQLLGYLVSVGADVNAARTTDGWTPVFLATVFGQTQLVMALLQNGAKVSVRDHEGLTPEDWAARYRMEQVRNLLLHSRSKVPHSRFSCVQRGPALDPVSPSSSTDDSDATGGGNAHTSSPPLSVSEEAAVAPIPSPQEASEACLLTAQ